MKNGFFSTRIVVMLGLALLVASLMYLSTEEKYEVKEITKEIKLIPADNK